MWPVAVAARSVQEERAGGWAVRGKRWADGGARGARCLRPGEKLYEELLMKEEGLQDTANKLIHIGKPIEFDKEHFFEHLEELKEEAYAETGDIRTLIQKVAPTYHPKEN